MGDRRDVVVSVVYTVLAGMVCDLDGTVGKTCVLRSPLTTFDWTCLLVRYDLSSHDVKLTLDLLAGGVSNISYTLLADMKMTLIPNHGLGPSINLQLTASRHLVSTAEHEFALVTSVTFHNCTTPEGMPKTVNFGWLR